MAQQQGASFGGWQAAARAAKSVLILIWLAAGGASAQVASTTTLDQPTSPVPNTVAVSLSAAAQSIGSGGGGQAALRSGAAGSSQSKGASIPPDGSMSFWKGSQLLGTVAVAIAYQQDGSMMASAGLNLPAGTFAPGTYSITASYSGSSELAMSTSTAKTLVVTGGTVNYPSPPTSPVPGLNYEYDAVGNLTKVTQAKGVPGFGFETIHGYDKLSRRTSTTDAKSGLVQFGYGGQDEPTLVTDPRSLLTQTVRDGLGQPIQVISPDTGSAGHTYDAAGNLKTRLDSRGVLASHGYDALNRLTSITYSKPGSTSQAYVWTYDETGGFFINGVGRLTTATFPEGSTSYTYDAQGRPTQVRQILSPSAGANPQAIILYTGYAYTAAGKPASLTYPSGRKLTLGYSGGQPSSLGLSKDAASAAVPLLSNLQYNPFGEVERWDWAMNSGALAHVRVMDASGRFVRYPLGEHLRDLSYDAAGRITAYTHYTVATGAAAPAHNQQFGYDELGRLTQASTAQTSWTYTYDANGNRSSVAMNGGAAAPYTVASTSNRLNAVSSPPVSFSHDAAGNITSDGNFTLGYDLRGRLTGVAHPSQGSNSYTYDSAGQRVRKSSSAGSAGTVVFIYDTRGQLLGEYDSTGAAIREYVWLDDLPVAVFTPDPALGPTAAPLVYYVHADHLNTPRAVVDRDGNLRWRWMGEPFGTAAAETSPGGLAAFTFNLRFPGQFYDAESGVHYNMQRDYLPGIGRYAQSDPIGLAGGINTYSYALNQPTKYTDPSGLLVPLVIPGLCAAGGCEALVAAGVMMSTPGKKAIKSIAQKIQDLCTPDEDPCDAQQMQEEFSCGKYRGWVFRACMERASIRGDMCRRKQPNPPPPWSDADVNGWAPPPAPRSK
jgi:RHS repeat-associated protein